MEWKGGILAMVIGLFKILKEVALTTSTTRVGIYEKIRRVLVPALPAEVVVGAF
jgi:hypothetical protein